MENEQAVSTKLDAGIVKALDDLSKPLFDKLGDYLDLWKTVEESRIW